MFIKHYTKNYCYPFLPRWKQNNVRRWLGNDLPKTSSKWQNLFGRLALLYLDRSSLLWYSCMFLNQVTNIWKFKKHNIFTSITSSFNNYIKINNAQISFRSTRLPILCQCQLASVINITTTCTVFSISKDRISLKNTWKPL